LLAELELRELRVGDVVADQAVEVGGEPDLVTGHVDFAGAPGARDVDRRQLGERVHVEAHQDRVVGRHVEDAVRALVDVGQDAEVAVDVELRDGAGRRDPSDLRGRVREIRALGEPDVAVGTVGDRPRLTVRRRHFELLQRADRGGGRCAPQ
jgi:hypothetical protein